MICKRTESNTLQWATTRSRTKKTRDFSLCFHIFLRINTSQFPFPSFIAVIYICYDYTSCLP